jgi:hypothetical protein
MHGSIKSHRKRAPLIAFVLALSAAAAPASAQASPLLSGYGGPGQGNQAILGSALLNGPSSGGGNGSGSATGSARGGARSGKRNAAGGQGNIAPTGIGKVFGGASTHARLDSETLGLSGTDLLYIVLALGVLLGAGVFTRRLARMTPRRGEVS